MAESDRFYGTTGIVQSGLMARGARDVPPTSATPSCSSTCCR